MLSHLRFAFSALGFIRQEIELENVKNFKSMAKFCVFTISIFFYFFFQIKKDNLVNQIQLVPLHMDRFYFSSNPQPPNLCTARHGSLGILAYSCIAYRIPPGL